MSLLSRIRSAISPARPLQAQEPASPISPNLRRILRPDAAQSWMLPGLSTLTPAYIEMLLRQGFSGSWTQVWDLFQLMEDTWPRLAHNLETLKREVCDMQWSLEPWVEKGKDVTPEAEERAMVVQACLDACHPDPADEGETDFNGLKFDLLDAWGKGLSVAEVLWTHGDAGGVPDLTFPVAFRWAHPKHYTMGSDGRLGRTDPATKSVIPFEPDQWIIAKSKGKTGHLNYAARLRALAWWWCASNFSSDWLLNLAQVFGLPFRWANYDPAAGETTVERVCQMLENMGSAGWAAFPAGTTMELVESSKGGPGTTPQDNIMDRADKQCDILLLGQTLTTEGGSSGGNRALGQVHESSRDKKIKAASQWLAAIVNRQLIPSILTLNYGDTSMAPHFNPNFQEQEDEMVNAQRDAILIEKGVKIPAAWFYERHRIPKPAPGEEVIERAAPMLPPGMAQPGGLPPFGKQEDQDEEQEDEEQEEATQKAKMMAQAFRDEVAQALAADLQPIRQRLSAIMSIQDELIRASKLKELARDLQGDLRLDILRDPSVARALEAAMAEGFKKGVTDE